MGNTKSYDTRVFRLLANTMPKPIIKSYNCAMHAMKRSYDHAAMVTLINQYREKFEERDGARLAQALKFWRDPYASFGVLYGVTPFSNIPQNMRDYSEANTF